MYHITSGQLQQVQNRGGAMAPLKTYKSNFIHHDFVQFRRQHS